MIAKDFYKKKNKKKYLNKDASRDCLSIWRRKIKDMLP